MEKPAEKGGYDQIKIYTGFRGCAAARMAAQPKKLSV